MIEQTPWEAFRTAVAAGQEGAIRRTFEELYRSVRVELIRFATWCVTTHDARLVPGHVLDAEEVVEDAFTELYRNRERINRDAKSWVLAVIRRTTHFRVSRALKEIKENPGAQRQLDRWRREGRTKSRLAKGRRASVRKAVVLLPPRMKAVVFELFYRDESIANTAQKLGISENAVIQARGRAITKLEGILLGETSMDRTRPGAREARCPTEARNSR